MKCDWCGEQIEPGERADFVQGGNLHRECAIRGMVGSVGHQLRECHCYGGAHEDPPGHTKRQAARAAQRLSRMLQDFRELWP